MSWCFPIGCFEHDVEIGMLESKQTGKEELKALSETTVLASGGTSAWERGVRNENNEPPTHKNVRPIIRNNQRGAPGGSVC